jgi:exodeoxyribonuclease III
MGSQGGKIVKIASFNANSLRARMPVILRWLGEASPDILCLQETKVQDKDFPRAPLEGAGYQCCFRGQKSYNGVAILSRTEPTDVVAGFHETDDKESPRLIRATIGAVTVINTYIPQGQEVASEKFEYKLDWFKRLGGYFRENFSPADPLIWVGDFNVAPTPIDVYDPETLAGNVCFHPDEHRALASIMDWGFVDVYRRHRPTDPTFSFFDYRIPNAVKRGIGWRIDHICATEPLAARSVDAVIDVAPRLWPKPSDHTFIAAEFDLP